MKDERTSHARWLRGYESLPKLSILREHQMTKAFFLILLLSITLSAQRKFEIKNASKNYDVHVEVGRCEGESCSGRLKVELFKKSAPKPFQVINLDETEFAVEEAQLIDSKGMYNYQSIVFFEDYNFDGAADLSIRDGNNSGYGGPSYRIYLFSPRTSKFVFSQPFTDLGQGEYLGMFQIDRRRKKLRAYSKSGCCLHRMDEFIVVGNRPKKILEVLEDATIADEKRVRVTTKRLIKGRWRTTVKYVRRAK
ncbi:MAG TPA: hypothetical protein VF553_14435 [Pyrinomonadaceae bacterium]